ncbi:post-GPI attachment to proteins factor 2-like [Teleopsis dalmanni]|uniref:post-GPI attachment to proteins factor 2-like n=1 Tax=Teleopsis dalmanni TaxID=139649 RepID=UPI0018CF108B|nr:post-GPI attachment to proteins factor 2-like [Teleopsis dalmanni]
MLPTYKRLDGQKRVAQVSFKKFISIVLSLPLGGFTFCVLWSLIFEFERSTRTHCDVSNLLPSLSAAIGTYEPQKTIWRLAICLHMPARLIIAHLYYKYYRDVLYPSRHTLAKVAYALNVIENLALVSLSLWTSTNDYEIHRNAFVTFIACSELYMLITYILNRNGRRDALLPHENKSNKWKGYLFIINLTTFLLAGYCFIRHNSYCEPGVYTFFAIFEYIVVWTNMGFHMTAVMDFYALKVIFDWKHGIYLSNKS